MVWGENEELIFGMAENSITHFVVLLENVHIFKTFPNTFENIKSKLFSVYHLIFSLGDC